MKKLALSVCLVLFIAAAFAQVDTIHMKDKRLLTANLKPGMKQYLVYFQNTKNSKSLGFWFWLRDIKQETRNSQKVFIITQHWLGSDTNAYRSVYSINRAADFGPIYHSETSRSKVNSYNWTDAKINGADSVANNTKSAFSLDFKEANFNWNLDIETFEMLPLAQGKTFAINFYDAGLDPPKFVLYKVTGSEVINTYDNHPVDCWNLMTEGDYNGTHFSETYWISKKTHEFLKEEDAIGGSTYRYKVKLPASVYNLMTRFTK